MPRKYPPELERRNLQTRRPEEDGHYHAARTAHKTADKRRGIHQAWVESWTPAEPYWITREQALQALDGLGVLTLGDGGRIMGWTAPKGTKQADLVLYGSELPPRELSHQLQAEGGLIGTLVRHLTKWLPRAGMRVSIPLEDRDRKEVERHLGRGVKLPALHNATVGPTGGTVTPE